VYTSTQSILPYCTVHTSAQLILQYSTVHNQALYTALQYNTCTVQIHTSYITVQNKTHPRTLFFSTVLYSKNRHSWYYSTLDIHIAYLTVQYSTNPYISYYSTVQYTSTQLTLLCRQRTSLQFIFRYSTVHIHTANIRYRTVHIHCTVYSTVNLSRDCSKKTIIVTSIIIFFSPLNTVVYNNMNHVVNLRRYQPHGIRPTAVWTSAWLSTKNIKIIFRRKGDMSTKYRLSAIVIQWCFMLYDRVTFLYASGRWSKSLQNWFFLYFYDDISHFTFGARIILLFFGCPASNVPPWKQKAGSILCML
jgi:hypothetical protein